jgi:hypothetical protein
MKEYKSISTSYYILEGWLHHKRFMDFDKYDVNEWAVFCISGVPNSSIIIVTIFRDKK